MGSSCLGFHRVRVGCVDVLPLQTHNLRASTRGDALEFGASQLYRAFFRNLEWLCEMKMEEIRGLNMDLNFG